VLAKASINTHLLMIVSALAGTGVSLLLPVLAGVGRRGQAENRTENRAENQERQGD